MLVGASLPVGWADRVETCDGTKPQLVRPDGYVAWVGGQMTNPSRAGSVSTLIVST